MSSASSRMAAAGRSPTGDLVLWLSPGFELVEGLAGLGKGVGDGGELLLQQKD
jgi:hypothetical protein